MADTDCLYRHGFLRVGACVPRGRVADPAFAVEAHLELAREGDRRGAAVLLFPELGLSSYAIDDLLLQDALLDRVETAIGQIVDASRALHPVLVVGAPLRRAGQLFNTAVVIHRGEVLGVVPKSYLPNYREFYERRHFAPGIGTRGTIGVAGRQAPFGDDLLFRAQGGVDVTFHVEICEDIWVPLPPSTRAALAGAELLLNLSASNITIGKARHRRLLCASHSARCIAAYAYAAAGPGESTTDLAWDGQAAIFENGEALAESARFPEGPTLTAADVDLERLRQERLRTNTFGDCVRAEGGDEAGSFRTISFALERPAAPVALERLIERFPYVPADASRLAEECYEAYNIQVQGLAQRLVTTGLRHAVIGVSGGLDSTQALIVAARVMDLIGRPRTDILAYTLPGFATSEATRANALALIAALGATPGEIDIRPAARQMLADLGHPFAAGEPVYDVTFENVQAGLRTDYLFRLANQRGGLVVGTGDLSELGLGWCTYGVGDHMSHYNVNASVPKTLIQHLIRFVAASGDVSPATVAVLEAVLATEISPELVPAHEGATIQSTQQIVGPYALQDFNLYYLTRHGFRPSRIAFLAERAWGEATRGSWPANTPAEDRRAYSRAEIRHWLRVFLKRFFANQFKRSALPNGPKITAGGSLSPRGDWRAPSDAQARVWLDELDASED